MSCFTGEGIEIFRQVTILSALKMELLGIRFKGGRIGAMKTIKRDYPQFSGCRTRKDMLKAFEPWVNEQREAWIKAGKPGYEE